MSKDIAALKEKTVTYSQVERWAGDGAAQQPQDYRPPGHSLTPFPHSSCLYLVRKRTLLSLIELVDAFSSVFLEIKVCG